MDGWMGHGRIRFRNPNVFQVSAYFRNLVVSICCSAPPGPVGYILLPLPLSAATVSALPWTRARAGALWTEWRPFVLPFLFHYLRRSVQIMHQQQQKMFLGEVKY